MVGNGIIPRPATWEELLQIIQADRIDLLGRSIEEIKRYRKETAMIKAKYASVEDYILIRRFERKSVEKQGKLAAVRDADSKKIVVHENDFSYYTDHGIRHHLIWSNDGLTENQIQQVIEQNFAEFETVSFVNPRHLQSVRGLWHAHVFTRPPPAVTDDNKQAEKQ